MPRKDFSGCGECSTRMIPSSRDGNSRLLPRLTKGRLDEGLALHRSPRRQVPGLVEPPLMDQQEAGVLANDGFHEVGGGNRVVRHFQSSLQADSCNKAHRPFRPPTRSGNSTMRLKSVRDQLDGLTRGCKNGSARSAGGGHAWSYFSQSTAFSPVLKPLWA